MTDEDIDEYVQSQEEGQIDKMVIITNIEKRPEKDEEYIKQFDEENYDVEFTDIDSENISDNIPETTEKIYKMGEM